MFREQQEEKYRSVSHRSENLSETRLLPVSLSSVFVSLSRWSLSSSASPAPILNGLTIGEASAVIGSTLLTLNPKTSDFVTTIPRNFASIQRQQQTLNICSRSVGASFGALPTEQTTTSLSTLKQAASRLNILTRQQTKSTFPMLSSRRSA